MKFSYIIVVLLLCFVLCSCASMSIEKENFTVNERARNFVIGEIEFQVETFFGLGNLKKITVPVTYFPADDAVCLQFWYSLYNHHQFWSKNGRMMFKSALESYNNDYNEQKLSRKERGARQKYGNVLGYLVWQQSSFFNRSSGNMRVNLGYAFKSGTPFFTVNQLSAEAAGAASNDNKKVSDSVLMYFTREQAAKLADLFDQDLLIKFSAPGVMD